MDDASISNSYATGDVSASGNAGGLVGDMSGSSIVGKNYYVDSDGTNGIGQRQHAQVRSAYARQVRDDAASDVRGCRRAMRATTTMFPTGTTNSISHTAWDSSVWDDFTTAGKFPCLKGVTPGCTS